MISKAQRKYNIKRNEALDKLRIKEQEKIKELRFEVIAKDITDSTNLVRDYNLGYKFCSIPNKHKLNEKEYKEVLSLIFKDISFSFYITRKTDEVDIEWI